MSACGCVCVCVGKVFHAKTPLLKLPQSNNTATLCITPGISRRDETSFAFVEEAKSSFPPCSGWLSFVLLAPVTRQGNRTYCYYDREVSITQSSVQINHATAVDTVCARNKETTVTMWRQIPHVYWSVKAPTTTLMGSGIGARAAGQGEVSRRLLRSVNVRHSSARWVRGQSADVN